MKRQEYHFVVIYNTKQRKWYIANACDFLSEGCIWDFDEMNWLDWDEVDVDYNKQNQFLEETLEDFNIFAETYPVDAK